MKRGLIIFGFAFLAGTLVVSMGMLYYTAQKTTLLLKRARVVITEQQESFYQGNRLLYGTVTAVDPATRRFTATFDRQFAANTQPVSMELVAATDAYIARQDLIQQNGVTVGLDEPQVGTLNDILIGDNIAVIAYYLPNLKQTVAVDILYGNPL